MKNKLFILVFALFFATGLQAQIKGIKPLVRTNVSHAKSLSTENQFDFFIKIEGVDGESKDDKHRDWIAVEGFEFNLTAALTPTGQPTGHHTMSMYFQKFADKSSVDLMQKMSTNSVIPEMLLEVTYKTGKKSVFMQYEFSNVRFSKFDVQINQSKNLEEINIFFERAKITYYNYNSSGDFISKKEHTIAPNSMY